MKKILLIGCGAEIGSMLLGMLQPQIDGLQIAAVLTHPVATDPSHPDLTSLDGLCARLVLGSPQLLDLVAVEGSALIIRGQQVPVFFGDLRDFTLEILPGPFDLCVVATSKSHIGDRELMGRCLSVARFVVGVAEATGLPGLYPPLLGAPERFLPVKSQPAGSDERIFALGSCQTNGWLAQLRGVLEFAEEAGLSRLDFRGLEVDIVHPDTPTGRLGTASLRAREQDPRNNLRPGFSQVESTMDRLFPGGHNLNTVSLRTLTQPPGYQLCRFFFSYATAGPRLGGPAIAASLGRTARRLPKILRLAERPYGSRGFEQCEAAAVILPQPALLRFADDPFGLAAAGVPAVSELILQAYVHNTRGYCRSVIEALRFLVSDEPLRVFAPVAGKARRD